MVNPGLTRGTLVILAKKGQLNDPEFLESLFPDKDVLAIELEPSNVEPWCWKLYFDGDANTTGNRVGAVLVSPKG